MKRCRALPAIATVIVALGTLGGGLYAQHASAQTRAAVVKDLNNPAYQPFAASSGSQFFATNISNLEYTLMTVAAGKRAVVEHFSCISALEAGNTFVRLELRYIVGGVQHAHQFVTTRVGPGFLFPNIDILSLSQPVRFYADPSTNIVLHALRQNAAGYGAIDCSISGHRVDTTP